MCTRSQVGAQFPGYARGYEHQVLASTAVSSETEPCPPLTHEDTRCRIPMVRVRWLPGTTGTRVSSTKNVEKNQNSRPLAGRNFRLGIGCESAVIASLSDVRLRCGLSGCRALLSAIYDTTSQIKGQWPDPETGKETRGAGLVACPETRRSGQPLHFGQRKKLKADLWPMPELASAVQSNLNDRRRLSERTAGSIAILHSYYTVTWQICQPSARQYVHFT